MALAHLNLAERKAPHALLVAAVLSNPLTWVAFATAVLIAANNALTGPGLLQSLGDTDDAVRLLTVRELLAGGSYFDTTLARIGAPDALVSHWSRLIDVPLAAMIAALQPFTGGPTAELITRATWPVLLFAGLALIVTREAARLAGDWAPGVAMALLATCAIAMVQFRPGRIDHHNAQILCAVAGVLFLRRAFEEPRAGWAAGVCIGLGLAIGFEAILLVLPMLALASILFLLFPVTGRGALNAMVATTGILFVALAATTHPARYLTIHCDALSLNLALLAACGTAGLWLVSVLRAPFAARLAMAGVGAGAGLVLYGALEPACLAGPFGQVSPALKPIWLDHVLETQSLFTFTAKHPGPGLAQIIFLAAGVAAHLVLVYRERTIAVGLGAVGTLLATLLGLWQIKLMPYAAWLAVMPMAVLAAKLRASPQTTSYALRGFAALLITQTMIDSLIQPFLPPKTETASADANQLQGACYRTANVEKLARLETGLVAADIDLGPYVAALTPHRVVAAPYHRLDKGILAIDAIMKSRPEDARTVVTSLGVRYIATCAEAASTENATRMPTPKGLRARLLAGDTVPWLETVPLDVEGMRLWRVVK